MELIFENKWCKLYSKDTIYILRSKSGKYEDKYFNSLDQLPTISVGLSRGMVLTYQAKKKQNCFVICEGSPINGRLEIAVFEPVGTKTKAATYPTEQDARENAARFADTVESPEDHVICPAYAQGDNIQVWEVIEGRYYEVYNGPIIPNR
jgi:hypothetical protein